MSVGIRLTIAVLLCAWAADAQRPHLRMVRTADHVTIDGKMDEPAWQSADVAHHFKQYFPFDSSYAKAQTEVRMMYDDHFIYVHAIMHNEGPRKYITPSLRRDFRGEANDGFSIVLDTYQDHTNAFQFGINPFGVQREGMVSNGGTVSEDLSLTWDNKWFSEARILEDRWECEMAIPFKTLRYKEGLTAWNINFYRIDSHAAERSTWAVVPRFYPIVNLAFLNELIWDKPLHHPGPNVSVIPYVATRTNHNYENKSPTENQLTFGGDAKIGVSPALNLDLTVNPDFSQVEVDQQVTNLSRFEISYPEKRQFFLENADLFASFGSLNSRPFFSRRIGVTRSPTTGQNVQNPILGGARLSGKIDNKTRIGIMTMQADKIDTLKQPLPSINYSVAAIQRRIFSRSSIGLIMLNKQAWHDSAQHDFKLLPNQFNRLIGVDYNLASKSNRWNGKFFYHHSFQPHNPEKSFASSAALTYKVQRLQVDWLAQDIGENFNPEMGYTPRRGFRRIDPKAMVFFYPQSKLVNNHGPAGELDLTWTERYGTTDWAGNLGYFINFQNTADGYVLLRKDYTLLYFDFDPTNTGGAKLPAGTSYGYTSLMAYFDSNYRKQFYFNIQGQVGQYFNGTRTNANITLNYRIQPYMAFSLNVNYNSIKLPAPYKSADLLLVGPKVDFTFSRKLFWTTYVQYNNQISNMNINSRLQWRFRPVSDFYLVYTDNYFAETGYNSHLFYVGQPKLRALVLKLTYWMNM
ncbi:MAG: carbohydrate binding family 9 domain-containing protein [Cyclobacteriaceae bacterium]|nr:carbohydrate binding family 9 domain-containing protein [Cyclobacteriaceae bacterium]